MAVVDGCTFESPRYFNTLKEAEHAAAKIALMSLLADRFQEVVLHCYKNLLQELAQREGLPMPVYTATRTSSPCGPMFVSSVHIGGESFLGEEGNSKKQAEMKAARVAYSVLTERIGDFSAKAGDSEPEAATVTAGIDSSTCGMHLEETAEGGSTSFSAKAQHDHSGIPFVESSFPDIAFPKGIAVIPISDDRWVAVSLEFPND